MSRARGVRFTPTQQVKVIIPVEARACKSGRPLPTSMPNRCKPSCDRQCACFVRFQGDLLCEHDITRDQGIARDKAPSDFRVTSTIELVDVRRCAIADAVSLPAVPANNVKVSPRLKLC